MLFILVGLCFGAVYGANHGHHGGHNYVTASPENVDGQLHTLHTHFGQHLCLDLLLVDCSKHPISGDEVICGSDGLEYKNHCSFVHAACKFEHLTITNHGSCGQTATTAAPVVNTGAPAGSTAAPAGSTAAPAASTAAQAGSTAAQGTPAPGVSTTMMQSTTQTTTTVKPTIDPAFLLIKNVFCTNKDGISCLGKIEFMCGSDGTLYPNSCEFSKAKCDDNYLTTQDLSNCPGAPTAVATNAATNGASSP